MTIEFTPEETLQHLDLGGLAQVAVDTDQDRGLRKSALLLLHERIDGGREIMGASWLRLADEDRTAISRALCQNPDNL